MCTYKFAESLATAATVCYDKRMYLMKGSYGMAGVPKYSSLADTLRAEIAMGKFQEGQPLMTEEELAARFKVSRQTVRQAISLLEDDGLVRRVRGSGTYVQHGKRKRQGSLSVTVMTTYITDYIFPSIVRGIESVLSEQGCIMNLSATYNRADTERLLLTRALEQEVDGLIIEGTKTALPNPNLALYEELRKRNIPFVMINGAYPELKPCTQVMMDDEAGGREAAEHLISHGARSIGGIFKSDDIQGHLRYRGFAEALQRSNLPVSDCAVCWFATETRDRFLLEPKQQILQAIPHLDGIVCYNDQIALRLLETLSQQNIRVPEDVSVVSFDDSAYSTICHPRLTTLRHGKEAFGRLAAQKLLRMMDGEREGSSVLPWELVVRESAR